VERISNLLDPAFVSALPSRSLDELRAMKSECSVIELTVSYYRRLAQGRIEILAAERSRRDRGGSLEDLVADLPNILGAEGSRSTAGSTRVTNNKAPSFDLRWPDGREKLVDDSTLANLPTLDDPTLDATAQRLGDFERELSDARHELHGVIDVVEREIAARQVAGTP
jgi:hypothetical protein